MIGWLRVVRALVVIGVVAMMGMDVLCQGGHRPERPRWNLQRLVDALREFARANGGKYQATLDELLRPDAHGMTHLSTTRVPRDPWKHEYRYEPPRPGERVPHVWSIGRDGVSGTDDDVDSRTIDLE